MRNRGFSLIELIVAMGVGAVVLAVGYRAYVDVLRMQDVENRRESMMLAVQDAMRNIKTDVKSGAALAVTANTLVIDGGRVVYRTKPDGIERKTSDTRRTFEGAQAEFKPGPNRLPGVSMTIRAEDMIHRRPIRIEVAGYVSPRNR